MKVSFDLPLDPRHVLTPAALRELAEKLPGTPVGLATLGGPAERGRAGERVGIVLLARVEEDRVIAQAEVSDDVADVAGGFGLDARVHLDPEGRVERVYGARVAVVSPHALPVGARGWRRT